MQKEAYDKWKGDVEMLIVDEKSVYEIDEDCIKQRNVSRECGLPIEKGKRISEQKQAQWEHTTLTKKTNTQS